MGNEYDFKIASVNKDLRLCVIENSIFIEELASRVIGNILDIDWKNSKSLGHASTALSFFQKLQLIQDIRGIDKEDLKKLTCIAHIRNKFAHVSEINRFDKLFCDSSVGKEIQNNFLKWYFDKDRYDGVHSTKIEFVNRLCFYMLTNDVINILLRISDTHFYSLGVHEGKREVKEHLLAFCMSILTDAQRKEAFDEIEKLNKQT
ncbi:MAG: hypothetical protein C0459_07440 [Chitinophaga sp.]|jgi:hypothetical protein|nr:hypothetical protein [Chitinophaga sp.]